MKKFTTIMVAGSLLILGGCTKQTGPQGPAGPQGVQGAAGNANVIGNNKTVTIATTKWTLTGSVYSVSISDPAITSDIVSNGVVAVYKQEIIGATTTWTNLPDINGITSTTFNFYIGGFNIYVQNSDGTAPIPPGTITFRDVIISASARTSHPKTNWNNYDEAVAAISVASSQSSTN